jgi:hypothetical protein
MTAHPIRLYSEVVEFTSDPDTLRKELIRASMIIACLVEQAGGAAVITDNQLEKANHKELIQERAPETRLTIFRLKGVSLDYGIGKTQKMAGER